MGQVIKIGDSYYIEFEARGLKYQQKAGENEAQARALLASTEEKIRQGEMSAVVRDIPIPVFIKDFSDFAQVSYPAKSARRLQLAAEHFISFLTQQYSQALVLSHITPKVIEDYKFSLTRESNPAWVINFTLLLLREMFEYAIKLGYLNDNPTLHIRCVVDNRRKNPKDCDNKEIQDFLAKGVTIFRLAQLLEFDDVLRSMRFFPYLRHPLG